MISTKVAVDYELHFIARDTDAPIQTKFLKVQAITDKEAEDLGRSIAGQLDLKLFKVRRLERFEGMPVDDI